MTKLMFTTTGSWKNSDNFGCASLGLAGLCDNDQTCSVQYRDSLEGIVLTGSYKEILSRLQESASKVHAAIVLFGNAGGENDFMRELQKYISCPIVGGGAAIDDATGHSALISGGGQVAVFLITDERYHYEAVTKCIHKNVIETCHLELKDPRTLQKINGMDAAEYLSEKKKSLGFEETDFEHLTLSDLNHVNAHLSLDNGVIKSGRDLQETMILRYIDHEEVYEAIREFYDDNDAIIFGCAGLSGLLDVPLQTKSLGLFLFGEVCTTNGTAEFGNLMLSKLRIIAR